MNGCVNTVEGYLLVGPEALASRAIDEGCGPTGARPDRCTSPRTLGARCCSNRAGAGDGEAARVTHVEVPETGEPTHAAGGGPSPACRRDRRLAPRTPRLISRPVPVRRHPARQRACRGGGGPRRRRPVSPPTTTSGPDPGADSGPSASLERAGPARQPPAYCRSPAMIASMLRSASAVMVTNGFTPTLPGTRDPSTT